MSPVEETVVQRDRRTERRAARRVQSQTEILDAAEQVFGEDGIREGSLRRIGALSGFSTAAIYLFFENKQHLVSETLTRRGDELRMVVVEVADDDLAPLEKLQQIVDLTVDFFAARPNFRLLLRHIRGGATITGPVLAEYAGDVNERFVAIMTTIAAIVQDGQAIGEIRTGDAAALAHMYSVLLNEFVLLEANADEANTGTLTAEEFHALVDGALRTPDAGKQKARRRPSAAKSSVRRTQDA
jgi:AcrR family transcriptional regulator